MSIYDLVPTSETMTVEITRKGKTQLNTDGTVMSIEVYLPHSKQYKEVRHNQADFLFSKGDEKLKSVEYENLNLEFIVEITKDWNLDGPEGKLKFTKKEAKKLYDLLPFIPKLIRKELDKHEDFS